MKRMYAGIKALSRNTDKPGLLLARSYEVFMRLGRMKFSWEKVLDSLDNASVDLSQDLLVTEDWIVSSHEDIFDPIPVWDTLFQEIKREYNSNFHQDTDDRNLGVFLLYNGEVTLSAEEEQQPCILHTSEKRGRDSKKTKDTRLGRPEYVR